MALCTGRVAGSIALVGFGIDSFAETVSAAVVVWRLLAERRGRPAADPARLARVEQTSGRIMAGLLFLLAAYIATESTRRLLGWGPGPILWRVWCSCRWF